MLKQAERFSFHHKNDVNTQDCVCVVVICCFCRYLISDRKIIF